MIRPRRCYFWITALSLGFAAVVARPEGQAELDGLFVEPDIQRRGVGRALVEYCADVVRAQGLAALYVTGNPHAEGFYIACGFEVFGTVETRFGVGLSMRKNL